MKRASIAETTLRKQVVVIETEIDVLKEDSNLIWAKIEALKQTSARLEAEIARLKSAREAASLRNKPHD